MMIVFEGNLGTITPTITIYIFVKNGVMEHIHICKNLSLEEIEAYMTLFKEFHDVFTWNYEEILGIDTSIIVHEIKTYPSVKRVHHKLWAMHPRKTTTIKDVVEKLLKSSFIYEVPLMEWVSNIIPVMKKQGMIWVCVDYHDLNKACPTDNYPFPFIDHCVETDLFSFMDGFSNCNHIDILPLDQHNTTFICALGIFS